MAGTRRGAVQRRGSGVADSIEPQCRRYDEAVEKAAQCLLAGSPCEAEEYNKRLREAAREVGGV